MMSKVSHICSVTSSDFNTLDTDIYTCGACSKKFRTICTLHKHVTRHSEGGAYHYDDVTKVALPKFDYACSSTQTDQVLTNFLQQLEFVRKFKQVPGIRVENLIETDEAAVASNYDVEGIKLFKKESDKLKDLDGNEEHVAIEYCIKEKCDSASRTHAVKKRSDEISRYDTDSVNELGYVSAHKTNAVKPCSVRLQRQSDKELNLIINNEKVLHHVNFEPKVLRKRKNSTVNVIIDDICREPSEYISKDREVVDDENDDVFSNYSVDDVEVRSVHTKEKYEKIKGTDFKIPMTMVEYRKTRRKVQMSKLQTNNKSLSHYNKQNENSQTNGKINELETEFLSNESPRKLNEEMNNKSGCEKENEYFYGKISFGDFEIERIRPKGIFHKGEKNELNKVSVDETWMPDSEWMLLPSDPDKSDEFEFSKIILDKEDKKLTKDDIKQLKRKWKYYQKPALVCNICGKSFKHNGHFKGHMNVHSGLKPYMCQYCGKSYHQLTILQTHQLHAHSDKSMWLTCQICGKKFPTAARLRVHGDTHANEYKHLCHKCNKSYKSAKLLKDHDKYVHCKKRFRCNNCKLSFDSLEERVKHGKAKHSGVNKCRFCGRLFTSLRSKVRHEKIHLGVKPHECHLCLRRFLQKTPFWVHMEKHHDITKLDLNCLFPEKHSDKNRQHLHKEMLLAEPLDSAASGTANLQIDFKE